MNTGTTNYENIENKIFASEKSEIEEKIEIDHHEPILKDEKDRNVFQETQEKKQNEKINLKQPMSEESLKKFFQTFLKNAQGFARVYETTGDSGKFFVQLGGLPRQTKPKERQEDMKPKVSDIATVANEVMTKSHIVILTGAGISVASGIPTFRGEGGYWTLRNKEEKIEATEFLTHEFFEHTPEEIWRWHHDFKKLVVKNAPNVSHYALADFQKFCNKSNTKFTMITQNIDGYHVDAFLKGPTKKNEANAKICPTTKGIIEEVKAPDVKTDNERIVKEEVKFNQEQTSPQPTQRFGICDQVYEIHGSINYMRCDKECTTDLYPAPEVGCADDFVPKCPKCQGTARPHTLFFDESYAEAYYRSKALRSEIETMDCLLVIGTALETNLAFKIVDQAITRNKLVIEINPQPSIWFGNVRRLVGKADEILPSLCQKIQEKMLETKHMN